MIILNNNLDILIVLCLIGVIGLAWNEEALQPIVSGLEWRVMRKKM